MRVVLPLGFELFLTTHSSPGSSFLPGIILSFNRSHQRLFLWRSPSCCAFTFIWCTCSTGWMWWKIAAEPANSTVEPKYHQMPHKILVTLQLSLVNVYSFSVFWQSRMAKAKPTWFCVNRGSCWLAACGWEFWRPRLCGKALFQWQCWHEIEYLICRRKTAAIYKSNWNESTVVYSGLSTIKRQHCVFITERQKWDAVIPSTMFVFLVRALAEDVPAQVACSCQKLG